MNGPDDQDIIQWQNSISWSKRRRVDKIVPEGPDEMTGTETLKLLQAHKAHLARDFGVKALALFGSAASDDAGPGSDVDILVAFDGPATSKRYFGVQFYLEDLLGRPVDLVTDKALRPELRPFVEREAIHV